MTLTAAGFPGSVNDREWARTIDVVGHDGTVGYNVSAASGDRRVSVAPGHSNVGGVLLTSDETATVQLPSNTSNYTRIDRVILRARWSDRLIQITYREGTPSSNPRPPELTRNPGVQYEVPLAEVTVRSGQGALSSADVRRTNTPPSTGFYYVNSIGQAPDPAEGALVWYNPASELMVGTPSGYQTIAGGSVGAPKLPSPDNSGYDHTSSYQSRAGIVFVHIDVERTGGDVGPGGHNKRLGILPVGSRPPKQIYATVMNQHSGQTFLVEIRTSGLVSCIAMQADTGERIRGSFGFLTGG